MFGKFVGEREILEEAITGCSVEVLDKFFGLESFVDREHISHKIFQLKSNSSAGYQYAGLEYVSDWVRDKVINVACQREISQMVKFVRSTAGFGPLGTLRGSTFEGLAHILLRQGGQFLVRSLDSREQENISLPCLEQTSFVEWDQVQSCVDNRYFRPVSKILKAIDSLERPNVLFQMTVAVTHPIHASGLIESVEKLGCTGEVRLYFPLPADRFDDFKKQCYNWPRAPEDEDASAKKSREEAQEKGDKILGRIRQFALLIDCRALQPPGAESLKQARIRRQRAAAGENKGGPSKQTGSLLRGQAAPRGRRRRPCVRGAQGPTSGPPPGSDATPVGPMDLDPD